MQTVKKWAKSLKRVSERGKLTTLLWPCVYGVVEKKRNKAEKQISVTVTLKFSLEVMWLISPLASNTIIPILKSRMWTIEGEIHWNRNIQSRVLTPQINKSNIFIKKADDKPYIWQKQKQKNQSRSKWSGIWSIQNWYLAELEGVLIKILNWKAKRKT